MANSVRLDKWLQVARVFKTRSKATHACQHSRVKVNGQTSKPHRNLALEDRVEIEFGDWQRVLVVKELADRTMAKADVPRIFEDESLPRPRLSELEKLMRRTPVAREKGAGRPSKKQRREVDRLRGDFGSLTGFVDRPSDEDLVE